MPNLNSVKSGRHEAAGGIAGSHASGIPKDSEMGFPLLQIYERYHSFSDLIVADKTRERLEYVVAENRAAEKLLSYGLRPTNRILLCGPPGTGKDAER